MSDSIVVLVLFVEILENQSIINDNDMMTLITVTVCETLWLWRNVTLFIVYSDSIMCLCDVTLMCSIK